MTDKLTNILEEILERNASRDGPLLPILHEVQNQFGYIFPDYIPIIAARLKLSRAEVYGVISFYHEFRNKPVGRNVIQICRAEACQSMGSRQLEAHAKKTLGIEFGETSADGNITLAAVYCLGNCACSPSIRIGDRVYGRVDEGRFDQLLAETGMESVHP